MVQSNEVVPHSSKLSFGITVGRPFKEFQQQQQPQQQQHQQSLHQQQLQQQQQQKKPVKNSLRVRVAPRSVTTASSVGSLVDPKRRQVSVSKLEVLPGVTVRLELPKDLCATLLAEDGIVTCSMPKITMPAQPNSLSEDSPAKSKQPQQSQPPQQPQPQPQPQPLPPQLPSPADSRLTKASTPYLPEAKPVAGHGVASRKVSSFLANASKQVGQKVARSLGRARQPEAPATKEPKWASFTATNQPVKKSLKRKKSQKSTCNAPASPDGQSAPQTAFTTGPLADSAGDSVIQDAEKFVVWCNRNDTFKDKGVRPALLQRVTPITFRSNMSYLPILQATQSNPTTSAQDSTKSTRKFSEVRQTYRESTTELSFSPQNSTYDALEKLRLAQLLLNKDRNKQHPLYTTPTSYAEDKNQKWEKGTSSMSNTNIEEKSRTKQTTPLEHSVSFAEKIMNFLASQELQSAVTHWMQVAQGGRKLIDNFGGSTGAELRCWPPCLSSTLTTTPKDENPHLLRTRLFESQHSQKTFEHHSEDSPPTRFRAASPVTRSSHHKQTPSRPSTAKSKTFHTSPDREKLIKFASPITLPDVVKSTSRKEASSAGRHDQALRRCSRLRRRPTSTKRSQILLRTTCSSPDSRSNKVPPMKPTTKNRKSREVPGSAKPTQVCFAAPSPWHELKALQDCLPEVPLHPSTSSTHSFKKNSLCSIRRSRSLISLLPSRSKSWCKNPPLIKTSSSCLQCPFVTPTPCQPSFTQPKQNKRRHKEKPSRSSLSRKSSSILPLKKRSSVVSVTSSRSKSHISAKNKSSQDMSASSVIPCHATVRMNKTALVRLRRTHASTDDGRLKEQRRHRNRRGAEGVGVTFQDAHSHVQFADDENPTSFPYVPSNDRPPWISHPRSSPETYGVKWHDTNQKICSILQKKKKVQFCDPCSCCDENAQQCGFSNCMNCYEEQYPDYETPLENAYNTEMGNEAMGNGQYSDIYDNNVGECTQDFSSPYFCQTNRDVSGTTSDRYQDNPCTPCDQENETLPLDPYCEQIPYDYAYNQESSRDICWNTNDRHQEDICPQNNHRKKDTRTPMRTRPRTPKHARQRSSSHSQLRASKHSRPLPRSERPHLPPSPLSCSPPRARPCTPKSSRRRTSHRSRSPTPTRAHTRKSSHSRVSTCPSRHPHASRNTHSRTSLCPELTSGRERSRSPGCRRPRSPRCKRQRTPQRSRPCPRSRTPPCEQPPPISSKRSRTVVCQRPRTSSCERSSKSKRSRSRSQPREPSRASSCERQRTTSGIRRQSRSRSRSESRLRSPSRPWSRSRSRSRPGSQSQRCRRPRSSSGVCPAILMCAPPCECSPTHSCEPAPTPPCRPSRKAHCPQRRKSPSSRPTTPSCIRERGTRTSDVFGCPCYYQQQRCRPRIAKCVFSCRNANESSGYNNSGDSFPCIYKRISASDVGSSEPSCCCTCHIKKNERPCTPKRVSSFTSMKSCGCQTVERKSSSKCLRRPKCVSSSQSVNESGCTCLTRRKKGTSCFRRCLHFDAPRHAPLSVTDSCFPMLSQILQTPKPSLVPECAFIVLPVL